MKPCGIYKDVLIYRDGMVLRTGTQMFSRGFVDKVNIEKSPYEIVDKLGSINKILNTIYEGIIFYEYDTYRCLKDDLSYLYTEVTAGEYSLNGKVKGFALLEYSASVDVFDCGVFYVPDTQTCESVQSEKENVGKENLAEEIKVSKLPEISGVTTVYSSEDQTQLSPASILEQTRQDIVEEITKMMDDVQIAPSYDVPNVENTEQTTEKSEVKDEAVAVGFDTNDGFKSIEEDSGCILNEIEVPYSSFTQALIDDLCSDSEKNEASKENNEVDAMSVLSTTEPNEDVSMGDPEHNKPVVESDLDFAALRRVFAVRLANLQTEHKSELARLENSYEVQIKALNKKHKKILDDAKKNIEASYRTIYSTQEQDFQVRLEERALEIAMQCDELQEGLISTKQQCEAAIKTIADQHVTEIKNLKKEHKDKTSGLESTIQEKIADILRLSKEKDEALKDLQETHRLNIVELKAQWMLNTDELIKKAVLNTEKEYISQVTELTAKFEEQLKLKDCSIQQEVNKQTEALRLEHERNLYSLKEANKVTLEDAIKIKQDQCELAIRKVETFFKEKEKESIKNNEKELAQIKSNHAQNLDLANQTLKELQDSISGLRRTNADLEKRMAVLKDACNSNETVAYLERELASYKNKKPEVLQNHLDTITEYLLNNEFDLVRSYVEGLSSRKD